MPFRFVVCDKESLYEGGFIVVLADQVDRASKFWSVGLRYGSAISWPGQNFSQARLPSCLGVAASFAVYVLYLFYVE